MSSELRQLFVLVFALSQNPNKEFGCCSLGYHGYGLPAAVTSKP